MTIAEFAHPEAFWLLLLVPVLAAIAWAGRRRGAVRFSSLKMLSSVRPSWRVLIAWVPTALRLVALVLAIVAVAQPRTSMGQTRMSTEGIAIIVVIDRSASMTAPMSFAGREMTRFEVVKRVFEEFVTGNDGGLKGRAGDMVGVVAFAGFADTLGPLARSHDALINIVRQATPAPPAEPEGGTAIGDALALAVARLVKAEEQLIDLNERTDLPPEFTIKSKVIVLLTDGENNRGQTPPLEAAEFAAEQGIKIYTVGIGGEGGSVSIPTQYGGRVRIRDTVDEITLTAVAERTGGKYWNARDAESLRAIYAELDTLEQTEIESVELTTYEEHFQPWLMAAVALVLLELILRSMVLRRAA